MEKGELLRIKKISTNGMKTTTKQEADNCQVTQTIVLDDAFMHNTQLVLHNRAGGNPSLSLKVYSVNRIMEYRINYDQTTHKYLVPDQLDVKSNQFLPFEFDPPVIKKKE